MNDLPILDIADFLADPVAAAEFPQAMLRWRNDAAAAVVGLDGLSDAAWTGHFARFQPLPGNLPQPLALRYHGHQFGVYNPDIGDGRGFLFAQVRGDDGRLLDLSTKGSGQTPYSRFGDGRLTLKGAVRELLATEMLSALGVNTSHSFSIIETGEQLVRGDEPSPTRSAVLVRLCDGSIRIGSFQRLAAMDEAASMARLLRHCCAHYGDMEDKDADIDTLAGAFLSKVAQSCARTVAQQMIAGFVHGVLNTDNINITGESFDYGPWRFTPDWDPGFVAAYFDEGGRYAFGRQAPMVYWNVGQLAMSLSLIASSDVLTGAMEAFAPAYEAEIARAFCWRLGVSERNAEADRALVLAGERLMREGGVLIDRFFVGWGGGRVPETDVPEALSAPLITALAGRTATRPPWWEATPPQSMHVAEVEAIWAAIAERDDWQPLYAKVDAVRAMGAALRDGPEQPKTPA
jgi:serine/tyrosine/threonine adenylyltransferase